MASIETAQPREGPQFRVPYVFGVFVVKESEGNFRRCPESGCVAGSDVADGLSILTASVNIFC